MREGGVGGEGGTFALTALWQQLTVYSAALHRTCLPLWGWILDDSGWNQVFLYVVEYKCVGEVDLLIELQSYTAVWWPDRILFRRQAFGKFMNAIMWMQDHKQVYK